MDYQPMSKPSFTFCSKMAVEHERVGNLLRCKSEPWIFYNIFIFFFFQDEDHFYVDGAHFDGELPSK